MVKCQYCGMLEAFSPADSKSIDATRNYRERGTQGSNILQPVCYAAQRDFRDEHPAKGGWKAKAVFEALQKDIGDCERFTKCQPGKMPRQLEEMNWQQLAADTQGRIADLQEKLLLWKQEQAKKDEEIVTRAERAGGKAS